MKSKKLPNPPMFDGNWNNLYPFITKLRLKLSINYNRYPIEASKVSYRISQLNKDAVWIIDPFFHNGTFTNLETLISLLK